VLRLCVGLGAAHRPNDREGITMRDDIHVRLRHIWVTVIYFPLTEEQAAKLAAGDKSDFTATGPLDMSSSPPICDRCQLGYAGAPYSCPGEPSSMAPDGTPVFRR
jgi:hypothetical protein